MRFVAGLMLFLLALPALCMADFWMKGGRDSINAEYHLAAWNGDLGAMKKGLDRGVDVDLPESATEDTPLMGAAAIGNEKTVRFLLEHGANVNRANAKGWTPVMWAAALGRDGTLSQLIAAGAKLDVPNDSGQTPLMLAAANGKTGAVKLLVVAGADKGARDPEGRTALRLAIETRSFAAAREIDPAVSVPMHRRHGRG